jgi:hypothetical protein
MININLILAVLSLAVTAGLALLGVDWITIGYGLNPWLAFPLAVVFGVIAIINAHVGCEIFRYNWMTKELERKMKRLTLHI